MLAPQLLPAQPVPIRSRAEVEEITEGRAEDPAARTTWELERTRDPQSGVLPPDIRARELDFASRLPVRMSMAKGAGVQAMQWRPLGPYNVGGRTRALAYDIARPDNILAGAVSGGMWRSVDGGASWTKTTAPHDVQSASCIVQDKRAGSTHVWYYGTGELLSTSDRRVDTLQRTLMTGNGIYKSVDNGASWTQLASTKGGPEGRLDGIFQGVWRMAVDNSNMAQDEVYAACYGAVMRSTDGGETWKSTLGEDGEKSFCSDVQVTSQGIVYTAFGSTRSGQPAFTQGVWRSTDGEEWTDITPSQFPLRVRRVVIAVAPSNENVMYMMTEAPRSGSGTGSDFTISQHRLWKYTYVSGDGSGSGGVWTELTNILPDGGASSDPTALLNTLGGYCLTLAVHPNNEEIVFLGGTNLLRTTDGFTSTLQQIGGYPPTWDEHDLHPDIHTVVFHPEDPDVMLVGNDGGITLTSNNMANGVVWEQRNNGYYSTQFYSIALDPASAGDDFVVGGMQDNGTFCTEAGASNFPWELMMGGDGTGCAVAKGRSRIYISAQGGFVRAILYDRQAQQYFFLPLEPPSQLAGRDFHFVTMPALEPVENKVLYLPARDRLWRHNDLDDLPDMFGQPDPNWQEMVNVETGGASIMAFGMSVTPAHRLYIGTNDGRVLRVDNANTGNPGAADVSDPNFPKGAVVSSISVDPDNADRVLVAFSNYNVQSLFYTLNGGATWDAVGGNLEGNPDGGGAGPSIRCVKILHPVGGGTLFLAGTSVGLFSTDNLAGTQTVWQQEGATVIGNVMVEALDARAVDGRIVAATYGNGVFVSTASPVSVEEPGNNLPDVAMLEQNYPNPVREKTTIGFRLPAPTHGTLALYNALGDKVYTIAERFFPAGAHTVELDVRERPLAAGTYFYRLQAGPFVQTRTMTVGK
jgi:hypothetical protein